MLSSTFINNAQASPLTIYFTFTNQVLPLSLTIHSQIFITQNLQIPTHAHTHTFIHIRYNNESQMLLIYIQNYTCRFICFLQDDEVRNPTIKVCLSSNVAHIVKTS